MSSPDVSHPATGNEQAEQEVQPDREVRPNKHAQTHTHNLSCSKIDQLDQTSNGFLSVFWRRGGGGNNGAIKCVPRSCDQYVLGVGASRACLCWLSLECPKETFRAIYPLWLIKVKFKSLGHTHPRSIPSSINKDGFAATTFRYSSCSG